MNEIPKTKSGWRTGRWILITLTVIATLVAIFYTEEDWRGKIAWENCKRQAEADGIVLDWNKFIPPSIPDDQNFFTASTNILLKFQQLKPGATNEIEFVTQSQWLKMDPYQGKTLRFPRLDTGKSEPIVVAKIIVSHQPAGLLLKSNALAVSFDDPTTPERVRQLIQSTLGQTIDGAQGFDFSQFQLKDIEPAQFFMQATVPPSLDDLKSFIPTDAIGEHGRLQLAKTVAPDIYQVQLTKNIQITAAADYIKWSDQFVPAFDEIREALKRPYAILPGDYVESYSMPIPNFVTMRELAQTLAQRAQCYLLLGEPDKALNELTLVHDVCRILEKPPTGQPETLVESMINVAITGLYVTIISEGLQRHAWQEPQLIALQQQLKSINLPVFVTRSFEMEPASSTHTLETTPSWKIADWFLINSSTSTRKKNLYETITDEKWRLHLEAWFIPRGWIYQNMAVIGSFRWMDGFDAENETISPTKIEDNLKDFNKMTPHSPRPYNFMAYIAVPNFTKAWQTTAYNQTMVNEAQIACALERCRLADGDYPDSLDVLVPKYIETLPHDLIGGQPLIYRRTGRRKIPALLHRLEPNRRRRETIPPCQRQLY